MEYKLTEKMYNTEISMIRRIGELAEKSLKPGDRYVSFAAGFPAPAALPVDMVNKVSEEVFKENGTQILQYGLQTGYEPLKEAIIKFLNKDEYKIAGSNDSILITYGSSEGLYILGDAFIEPGDRVIVEDPTYINAKDAFKLSGARLVGVPIEEDGVNLEALEQAFKEGAKFFYTIPTFANPTGYTTSVEKRKAVYELAVKYGIPVVEDNPYGYLRFTDEKIMPIKTYDTQGAVIYVGTMSKIISPGMRVGYICADKELIDRLTKLKGNQCGAVVNWSQYAITKILETVDIDAHIAYISQIYAKKAEFMYNKMKEYFHPSVKICKPQGGMFIWVTMPENVKALEFCETAAKELHVSVVPGNDFCTEDPDNCSSMRFNFSLPSEDDIEYGIKKIGELTYKYCK